MHRWAPRTTLTPPPRFVVLCISASGGPADRKWTARPKQRPRRFLFRRREKRRGGARERTHETLRSTNKGEGGGANVGRTNRERVAETLENGSGNSGKVAPRSWNSDNRSTATGGGSNGRVASPSAATASCGARSGMESSSSSTSSIGRTGGEASTSGGASGSSGPPGGGDGGKSSKKVCGVCGDRAKSYHFGGVSCDSCKAFFRRSVQNDAYKNFQCPYERRCDINVNSRKCCQYCRFHKCLLIGMETGWVMSEEERLQLLRQRMERKARQQQGPTVPSMPPGASAEAAGEEQRPATPDEASVAAALGAQEADALRELVDGYAASLREVPYDAPSSRPALDAASMFTRTLERIARFAGALRAFGRVSRGDRATLLRCGLVEACLLRAAFAYDAAGDRWPDTGRSQYRGFPCLRAAELRHLVAPELQATHWRFNRRLHDMRVDERAIMALMLVALFSPERPGLEQPQEVARIQDEYLALLRRYMDFRYQVSALKLFAELLLTLPDLRQLTDTFAQTQLRLSQGDIVHFRHQHGAILQAAPGQRRRRHSDGDGTGGAPPSSPGASGGATPSHPRSSSAFAAPPTSGSPSFAFQAVPPPGSFVAFGPTGGPALPPATPLPLPSTSYSVFPRLWTAPSGVRREPVSREQQEEEEEETPKNGTGRTS